MLMSSLRGQRGLGPGRAGGPPPESAQANLHQAAFEGLPDPVFVVDADLTVVYMNSACEKLVGIGAGEAVGKMKCMDVFQSDICATGCAIKGCMRTGQAVSGARVHITHRSGRKIPVSASASAVRSADGQLLGGMEVIRDITSQVEAEQAVRDREEYSTSIVHGIADPFFVAGRDLVVTYMNQACSDLTGYPVEEVVGKLTCRQVFKSNICDKGCALKHCMATGETISGARVLITDRTGRQKPILASAGSIRDGSGKVVGGFEMCRDITELVALEQRLQQAAEEASSTSEELAASIEQVSASTEEMSSAIAEVNTNSHEVAKAVEGTAAAATTGATAVMEAVEASCAITEAVRKSGEDMGELEGQSKQISQILEVISEISDQTNLLALNAAIEAARAGEHGRGFAVVADEVRRLASRAQSSTKEIQSLVQGINQKTANLTRSLGLVQAQVTVNAKKTNRVDGLLSEIVKASELSLAGVKGIVASMEQAAASTSETSASAQQVAAAAEELARLGGSLTELSSKLGLS